MIDDISKYVETIITLIIAITVVELIVPNSKNKKYVMFVSSLIIMVSVINPIIGVVNSNFDVNEKLNEIGKEINNIEYSSKQKYNLDYNIYNTYITNLENNMKNRLEDIGYEVLETKINVDKATYEPTNIEIRIKYSDGNVQPIIIDVFCASDDSIYNSDVNKIKEILSAEYGVKKENISINGA